MNDRLKLIIIPLMIGLASISSAVLAQTLLDYSTAGETTSTEDLNLSDQDRHTSQNYVHEWLSNRTMEEECAKLDDPNACKGLGQTEFMGVNSKVVEVVGKAFTAIIGSMGGEIKSTKTDAQGNEQESSTQDYCRYIAVGTEAVGTALQQMGQNELNKGLSEQDTSQKKMIYSAAQSHEQRSKTAKVQGTGFGATAGCYVLYIGKAVANPSILGKMAGAGFLAAFYLNESKKQKKFADEVLAIADQLPGKGDCNPITDKECYCAQPETANDTEHCLDYLHNKTIANTSYRVPCINQDAQADANCFCSGQEGCFDKKYFTDINLPGFDSFLTSSLGSQFKSLSNGELQGGTLTSTTSGNAAKTLRILKQVEGQAAEAASKLPPLTKQQQEQAAFAQSLGLSKSMSRLLAAQPVTAATKKKVAALSKELNGSGAISNNYRARNKRSRSKVIQFNNSKAFKSARRPSSNAYSKLKKGKKSGGSGKTFKYQTQQAADDAEISHKAEVAIFDIISRRYNVSAWRRLDLE